MIDGGILIVIVVASLMLVSGMYGVVIGRVEARDELLSYRHSYCRGLAVYNASELQEPSEDDYLYGDLEYDPWSEWIDLGGEG